MSFQAIKTSYFEKHRANLMVVGFLCSRFALAYTYPASAALLYQDLEKIVRSSFLPESTSIQ
jgi:hypothetical protein